MTCESFDGVAVFSATKGSDRELLGHRVTQWIAGAPKFEVVGYEVKQSSDDQFHCLSIVLFYRHRAKADRAR